MVGGGGGGGGSVEGTTGKVMIGDQDDEGLGSWAATRAVPGVSEVSVTCHATTPAVRATAAASPTFVSRRARTASR